LIVTCQNCDTSFQLDESRVPPKGIRVRCSRCKEAFFLPHPSASAADAVHEVAGDAATTGGTVAPNVTQDLPPTAALGQGASEEDEHDWEFNVDPNPPAESAAETDFAANRPEEASGLALEGEDEESSVEPEPEPEPEPDPEPKPVVEPEAHDESAFGSVDDFSSLMEEDDLQSAADLVDDTQADPPADLPAIVSDEIPDAVQSSDAGSSDDLGDPESWDFFGEDEAAASAGEGGAVLGRVELASRASLEAALASGDMLEQAAEWDEELYGPENTGSGAFTRMLGLVVGTAGWLLTIGVAGMGLSSGLFASAERLVVTEQSEALGAMRAESVRGYWLETARGERLLEVQGKLINRAGQPMQPEGLLEISLLDVHGRPLAVDSVLAGTPLAESALREQGPDELDPSLHRAAAELATMSLAPGQPTDFQAVFRDPPALAARFALRFEPMRIQTPVVDEATGSVAEADGGVRTLEAGDPQMPGANAADVDELTWGE
jgi:predicted Zn finger-like uncharacterized protein